MAVLVAVAAPALSMQTAFPAAGDAPSTTTYRQAYDLLGEGFGTGINANLWVGIVLLVFGALMLFWAVTRPIEVDEEQIEADKRAVEEAAGRRTDDEGGAGGVA